MYKNRVIEKAAHSLPHPARSRPRRPAPRAAPRHPRAAPRHPRAAPETPAARSRSLSSQVPCPRSTRSRQNNASRVFAGARQPCPFAYYDGRLTRLRERRSSPRERVRCPRAPAASPGPRGRCRPPSNRAPAQPRVARAASGQGVRRDAVSSKIVPCAAPRAPRAARQHTSIVCLIRRQSNWSMTTECSGRCLCHSAQMSQKKSFSSMSSPLSPAASPGAAILPFVPTKLCICSGGGNSVWGAEEEI